MKLPAPNRIAVYLGLAASIIVAVLPVVTDLGLVQVGSVLGGLLGVIVVLLKFLDGYQKYEAAGYQGQLMFDQYQLVTPPPPLTQTAPTPASKAQALKLPR